MKQLINEYISTTITKGYYTCIKQYDDNSSTIFTYADHTNELIEEIYKHKGIIHRLDGYAYINYLTDEKIFYLDGYCLTDFNTPRTKERRFSRDEIIDYRAKFIQMERTEKFKLLKS